MLNVFENMLAAENQKKYFEFSMKNIFQANASKVGATSNIIDELRKIFLKNKGLKRL